MIRKRYVIAALAATVSACTSDAGVEPHVPRADYAVYIAAIDSLVIRGWGSRRLILITPTVSDGPESDEAIEAVRADPNIAEDVRLDFVANNRVTFALHPEHLALDAQFTILAEDSVFALDSLTNYEPSARGSGPPPPDLIELSRVGFSRDSSHAVVYVGHTCGRLCGTGWKVQLRRDTARAWRVVTAEPVWIS